MAADPFSARSTLSVGGREVELYRLDALQSRYDVARLPYTLRILLENVLRTGSESDVEAVATWVPADDERRLAAYRMLTAYDQNQAGELAAIVDGPSSWITCSRCSSARAHSSSSVVAEKADR